MASIRTLSPNSHEVHFKITMEGIKKQRTRNFPTLDQAEAFCEAMSAKERSEREEMKLLKTLGVLETQSTMPIVEPPAAAAMPVAEPVYASPDLAKTKLKAANIPLNSLLDAYVERYGELKWTPGTMSEKLGYLKNYIRPLFGEQLLPAFTPLRCQDIIRELQKTKQVQNSKKCLTPRTIEEIHKLLKNAFNKGKVWQIIDGTNPWVGLELEQYEPEEKTVWTREQFATFTKRMLEKAEAEPDEELGIMNFLICLHLDMCCNARIGEATGLEWKNTIVSERTIADGTARVRLVQQLTRENIEALEKTKRKGVIKVFPGKISTLGPRKTFVVLKELKTRGSRREVFLPETTARLLMRLKELQARQRDLLGADYQNHDLVICLADGTPCDARVIQRRIDAACAELGYERVTTHSFRKTGTNTKLEVTHGDLKTAQHDNGHATHHMTVKTYNTMQVERQQQAAKLVDDVVFKGIDVNEPAQPTVDTNALAAALAFIQSNPDLLNSLTNNKAG